MTENIIQIKSYNFALQIVKFVQLLQAEQKEYVLSKQLLRSATFIGANIEESIWGISHADFTSKIHIAYKEARETHYWIRLIHDSGYMSDERFTSLLSDNEEILKIFWAIIRTWKNNKN
jgi:four helix bundle protein